MQPGATRRIASVGVAIAAALVASACGRDAGPPAQAPDSAQATSTPLVVDRGSDASPGSVSTSNELFIRDTRIMLLASAYKTVNDIIKAI